MFLENIYFNAHTKLLYENYLCEFVKILADKPEQTPPKRKYVRGNHLPFVNKELSKAIMNKTRQRNLFLQNKSEENKMKQKQLSFLIAKKN